MPQRLLSFLASVLLSSLLLNIALPVSANAESDGLAKPASYYAVSNFKKAVSECLGWLKSHPDDGDVERLLAKCYLAEGDFDKAVSSLASAKNPPGPLEQAMASQDSVDQNDDENLAYPDWLDALVLMYAARLTAENGQLDLGLKLCDKALSRYALFPECICLRSNILIKLNRLYEAEELYRQAVSLRPQDWHVWLGYSAALEKQQKFQLALDAMERAMNLIKTPPYQEPELAQRLETMSKKREYLASRAGRR